MFRAFLGYSGTEVEEMSVSDYIDSTIILKKVLELWHAPYMNKGE